MGDNNCNTRNICNPHHTFEEIAWGPLKRSNGQT